MRWQRWRQLSARRRAAERVSVSYEMESAECVVAGHEVKSGKWQTAATEAAERVVAATEAAERDAAGNQVKAVERVTVRYEMESAECEMAGYEVKAITWETAATEAAEREVAATKAAQRDAVGNEVKDVERVTL